MGGGLGLGPHRSDFARKISLWKQYEKRTDHEKHAGPCSEITGLHMHMLHILLYGTQPVAIVATTPDPAQAK
jgi:hypothetical protein